jgi:hypothetical protein
MGAKCGMNHGDETIKTANQAMQWSKEQDKLLAQARKGLAGADGLHMAPSARYEQVSPYGM